MTNVTTLMALAVIGLVSSIGFASAETIGDGSSEVHVYVYDRVTEPLKQNIGFNVTVIEGGSVVVHNESQRVIDIQHTGTVGTSKGGTFGNTIPINSTYSLDLPISNCSSCYPAGIYYFKDSISDPFDTALVVEKTGSITIIHPDGYTVQEEVGITENVVVVLGNNSTKTTPEPTPIEPEGKYNVATWTGTYDMVSLQEQLVDITTKFNKAVENLGHKQNTVIDLERQLINISNYSSEVEKLNNQLQTKNNDLVSELENLPDNTQQIANMISSVETLEDKVSLLEQQKAELTIEKEKWKTLSDNWYAVAMEQLQVMVNVLGL